MSQALQSALALLQDVKVAGDGLCVLRVLCRCLGQRGQNRDVKVLLEGIIAACQWSRNRCPGLDAEALPEFGVPDQKVYTNAQEVLVWLTKYTNTGGLQSMELNKATVLWLLTLMFIVMCDKASLNKALQTLSSSVLSRPQGQQYRTLTLDAR